MAADFLMEENEALRVLIPTRDRLLRECWAMAEQPRALDRNRIGEGPLTRLSAAEMAALEQGVTGCFGIGRQLMARVEAGIPSGQSLALAARSGPQGGAGVPPRAAAAESALPNGGARTSSPSPACPPWTAAKGSRIWKPALPRSKP
jgi:hypothetical protein